VHWLAFHRPHVQQLQATKACLLELHPAGFLTPVALATNGFPADLAFEARDTLHLQEAMRKVARADAELLAALEDLRPEVRAP
jgi:hypothetical protein